MDLNICPINLTLWWSEEVEEGVSGDRLGNSPYRATALVLLFLLDCFQCYVLSLRPVNWATVVRHKATWERGWSASSSLHVLSE